MVDRPLDPSEIPVREAIRRGSWVTDTQDPDCSYGSRPDRLLIFPDMERFLASNALTCREAHRLRQDRPTACRLLEQASHID